MEADTSITHGLRSFADGKNDDLGNMLETAATRIEELERELEVLQATKEASTAGALAEILGRFDPRVEVRVRTGNGDNEHVDMQPVKSVTSRVVCKPLGGVKGLVILEIK